MVYVGTYDYYQNKSLIYSYIKTMKLEIFYYKKKVIVKFSYVL